jgi:hypothetical protein
MNPTSDSPGAGMDQSSIPLSPPLRNITTRRFSATTRRRSGQGFAYNFGQGVAALNPTFVGLLSATLTLGQSIGVFAIIAYGIMTAAALALPETKGRELTGRLRM